MLESGDTLVSNPIPHADKAPADLTSDQRWAEWKEKGARQAARSARAMRLIWSIAVLALAIGFIWAFASR